MGQAAVDLPISPDQSPAPAPMNSADDLLSQLAGAEIDRMLADTDADEQFDPETEPEFEAESAADAVTDPAGRAAPARAADLEPETEDDPAVGSANEAYKAEVDQLFRQLDTVPIPRVPEPSPPAAAAAAPAPVPAPVHLPASEAAEATHAQETPEESTPAAAAEVRPATPEPAVAPDTAPPDTAPLPPQPQDVRAAIDSAMKQVHLERTPLVVRILEIVNLPLAHCPDVLRDVLGKVAILTLMNSVGVLLYLLLFRK